MEESELKLRKKVINSIIYGASKEYAWHLFSDYTSINEVSKRVYKKEYISYELKNILKKGERKIPFSNGYVGNFFGLCQNTNLASGKVLETERQMMTKKRNNKYYHPKIDRYILTLNSLFEYAKFHNIEFTELQKKILKFLFFLPDIRHFIRKKYWDEDKDEIGVMRDVEIYIKNHRKRTAEEREFEKNVTIWRANGENIKDDNLLPSNFLDKLTRKKDHYKYKENVLDAILKFYFFNYYKFYFYSLSPNKKHRELHKKIEKYRTKLSVNFDSEALRRSLGILYENEKTNKFNIDYSTLWNENKTLLEKAVTNEDQRKWKKEEKSKELEGIPLYERVLSDYKAYRTLGINNYANLVTLFYFYYEDFHDKFPKEMEDLDFKVGELVEPKNEILQFHVDK